MDLVGSWLLDEELVLCNTDRNLACVRACVRVCVFERDTEAGRQASKHGQTALHTDLPTVGDNDEIRRE